ncbi:hypothetical protein Ancab_039195 [Ancistrocladus abbreviatus]
MEEIQQQLQETQINGVPPPTTVASTTAENVNISSKRQRRPSVRLGEIGDQPAATVSHESYRRVKHWKAANKDNYSTKASKTRTLTYLGGGGTLDGEERKKEANLDNLAIGSWKTKDSKSKRGLKRPRTNWLPKFDEGGGANGTNIIDEEDKFCRGEDGEDGFVRDSEIEGSESPLKEQSPINSSENLGVDGNERAHHGNERELQFRRPHNVRTTIGNGRERDHHHHHDGIELDEPSDTDRNGGGDSAKVWGREDGVWIWLNGLGLGRYWPVFEIHEVDEEVLPMLTLEDLKDMGINAVGSRRKMFCAIQKLSKGFS